MILIPLIDANDQLVEARLDDKAYHLTVSWNEECGRWTMSVRDLNSDAMVSGIALVPSYPLLRQVRRVEMPPGEFLVDAPPASAMGRDAFASGSAYLWYLSRDDVEELAAQT